jgi:hypothetical protein
MMARFQELIEAMTLENMRQNGVRSLDVQCNQCRQPGHPQCRPLAGRSDRALVLIGWSILLDVEGSSLR